MSQVWGGYDGDYSLQITGPEIIAGSFGDLFGRKRVFLVGIAGFGVASLAAGLAQAPAELIAARVVQGAAAAAMIPQLLATFRTIFSHAERGKVAVEARPHRDDGEHGPREVHLRGDACPVDDRGAPRDANVVSGTSSGMPTSSK